MGFFRTLFHGWLAYQSLGFFLISIALAVLGVISHNQGGEATTLIFSLAGAAFLLALLLKRWVSRD